MTRFNASDHESAHVRYDWVIPSDSQTVIVPDAHLLFNGTFRRVGPDLIIEGDGKRALLPDYFSHDGVALHSVAGARLDAETVRALSGLDSPWVLAQAGGAAGPPEIGTVRKLVGSASVVRGGATQNLANGDPVYQGDVVQTGAASTLGIILKDNTVFSLSSDARMVMNQLVYDAARTDNSMSMSLVQGSFVFITGQIAKTGSVSVSTPVATMGIRGTTPIVKLSALDGSGEFSLSADPDRGVGNYILFDVNGNEVARVGSTDIIVRIQSAAGPFQTVTKTLAETAADNALVAPAFETYLLINQRGDIPTRAETGKGQGSDNFQFALKVTNIALLGETKLLDDGLFGTLQYLGGSRASGFNDILQSASTPLSVDLDTSSPGLNRFVSFPENSGPLPVTSAAQISVPNSATTITSATVILVNALAGDNMLVGLLPPGITATITFGSIHVNLTGTASVAAYIAAIQSIQFINTSDNPPTDIREITVTVVASNGETATATTFVTVESVNDAPVHIVPAGQVTGEDGTLVYSQAHGNAISVADPDAGTHPITTTLTVQHGTLTAGALVNGVTISGNGSGTLMLTGPQNLINVALDGLAYHPNPGFNGSDGVVISTNDNNTDGSQGSGGPLTTTTTGSGIIVNSVNDAPSGADTTITTTEDTPVALTTANFGFADPNDTPPNALLAVKITTLPDHGSLTLDGQPVSAGQFISAADIDAGKLVFVPAADANGAVAFTFQVQDDGGNSSGIGADLDPTPRTLSVSVTPVNDAPIANDDGTYTVAEDHCLTVSAAYGVLANDTDIDSASLTASVVTGPQHGNLTLNPDGSFVYTPTGNYNGSDSFTYKASDGADYSNTATVSLAVSAVNDAPVAYDDGTYTVAEDHCLTVSAVYGVLANDTDIDSASLTASVVTGPQHGNLTLNPDGSFVYTPTGNYNGSDSFTYKASDGADYSNTATVSLIVSAVNDAPVVSGPEASLPSSGYAVESLNPHFTPFESSPGVYQLTDQQSSQAAAIWHAIDLSQHWTWTTQVQLSSTFNPGGADGITFTLQTQGTDALTQLGGDGQSHGGGLLGVGGFSNGGLENAFGIWIDTWDNGEAIEANGNSISFYANDGAGQTDVPPGSLPHQLHTSLENGQWNNLTITWNASTETLSYRFTFTDTGETYAASQHFDGVTPGQTYYFGFTAATGAAFNDQAVAILNVETLHAVGQEPLSLKASGFAVADVDAGDGVLTATLQLGDAYQGHLNATEGDSGISIVSGNGTAELVLSGTLQQLNAFLGHGGTSSLTFTAIHDGSASSTTLTLTVDDNGNTGSGGPLSGSFTTTIFIDAADSEVIANPDSSEALVNNWDNCTYSQAATGNVLDNDSVSGGILSVASVSNGLFSDAVTTGSPTILQGQFGALTIASDGSYTYTPDQALLAMDNVTPGTMPLTDTFSYVVSAGGDSATSTLTIQIAPAIAHLHTGADSNIAYVSSETQYYGPPVIAAAAATGNVLVNDYADENCDTSPRIVEVSRDIPDGETCISTQTPGDDGGYGFVIQGEYGTLFLEAGGSYSYHADGTNAAVRNLALDPGVSALTDVFTYTAEFEGVTKTETLSITVNGTLALSDTATALEAGGTHNEIPGHDASGNVLSNDNGLDTVTSIRGVYAGTVGGETFGYYGRLTIGEDGQFSYSLNPDYDSAPLDGSLKEVFTYTASANGGPDQVATLTISIVGQNDAPITTSFVAASIPSDYPSTYPQAYQVFMWTGIADDNFAYVNTNSATATAAGIASLAGHYSNDNYTFYLFDVPTVFAGLTYGEHSTLTVNYTVRDGTYSTPGQFTFDVVGDHTPHTPNVTASLVEAGGVANGTAGTPVATGNLLDYVTDIDIATNGDSVHVTSLGGNSFVGSITIDYGFVTFQVAESGTYTVTLNDAASFNDALSPNQSYTTGISYTVTDSLGFSSTGTLVVAVTGANDAPVALADIQIVAVPAVADSVVYAGNVIANDADVDYSATLNVSFISGGGGSGTVGPFGRTVEGDFGQLTIFRDGSYTYEPLTSNGTGPLAPDVFQYTIVDDQGATSVGTLTFDRHHDTSPIAYADANTAEEGTGPAHLQTGGTIATGNVLANDVETDNGDTLTLVTISSDATGSGTFGHAISGEYGTLLISADGSYRYVADDNQGVAGSSNSYGSTVDQLGEADTLVDTFTYTIADSHGVTSSSTLAITINGNDDAPRVSPIDVCIDEDFVINGEGRSYDYNISVFDTAYDPEGSSLELHNVTITPALTTASGTVLVVPVHFTVDEIGDISFDVRQFYYLQSAIGGDTSGTPDLLTLNIGYDVTDEGGLTTHGTATVNISGLNEGETFTGVGRSVETIDFSSANFHNTKTIAFDADAPLHNPNYAVDVLTNFDNMQHRIDLSAIFDALAPGSVTASNIGNYVNAAFNGTSVTVGANAISGAPFNVASIVGTAGSDHHTIAAGDTIAIVFDHVNAANVTVHA